MGIVRKGDVERYLLRKIKQDGAIHLTLLDPEKTAPDRAATIAKEAVKAGTTAIMVGSSTFVETRMMDEMIKALKATMDAPVIIFPNNITAISPYADAIWFMSLLNSTNPYFTIGAQALVSPLVKKYDLEPIPLGYIVVGYGETVGFLGQARPIPYDKPEIASSYALAAQYLGMRFVYLDAGSGAPEPVPASMISKVKDAISIPLIVGGGIRTKEDAYEAIKAGADAIVTGTITEEVETIGNRIGEIVRATKRAAAMRRKNTKTLIFPVR